MTDIHNPLQRAIGECLSKGSATLTTEEVKAISDQLRAVGSRCPHDWQPDGGEINFESHQDCDLPHLHTTCSKCGAKMWWTQWQWEKLTEDCSSGEERS